MDLRLTLRIRHSDVAAELHNPTDHPVRVWRLGNSWGGDSWALRLSPAGLDERARTIRPTNQGYTRNVPGFLEIAAHGDREVGLAPSAPEWAASEDIGPLRDIVLSVQAVLEIAPTPEATKHDVLVGRVESAPVVSQPPHTWLFGASEGHGRTER